MTNADLEGLRILIVEDEYLLAEDLRTAVRDAGGEVLGPVPSVAQAADLLDAGFPLDAALLDVNLRGEMVFAIADMLEARNIPFAFVTGYKRSSIPDRYAHIGHFEKPIRPEDVARLARASLTRTRGSG